MKTVDLNSTLCDVTGMYPNIIPVLAALGFNGVTDEQMRNTHGRVMTIRMGCQQLGIDMEKVIKELEEKGYNVKK
jgi:hypothetical protein